MIKLRIAGYIDLLFCYGPNNSDFERGLTCMLKERLDNHFEPEISLVDVGDMSGWCVIKCVIPNEVVYNQYLTTEQDSYFVMIDESFLITE